MTADRARGRFALRGVLLTALLSLPIQPLLAAVSISDISGTARVRRPNTASWNEVPVNYVLSPGDEVKTDRSSRVTISFDDSSRVEIGPNSSYLLEETQPASMRMSLNFGKLKAWVTKASSRRFAVRTPTAVCSVRGTEFGVDVGQDGRTSVELFTGQLGVADNKGNEVLLNPGERVDVSLTGLGKKEGQESKRAEDAAADRASVKKEVSLEMSKEDVLAAAADEIRQAEYQAGKAIIDMHGNRVRIESYVLRPQPNSFKLVVLNERLARFDYMYYKASYAQALPTELATAVREMNGCLGPCNFTLVDSELALSNTRDSYRLTSTYGAQVTGGAGTSGRPDYITKPDGEWHKVLATDTVYWQNPTQNVFVNGVNFNGVITNSARATASCSQDAGPSAGCNFDSNTVWHKSDFFGSSSSNWFQMESVAIDDDGKMLARSTYPGSAAAVAERAAWFNKNNFEFVFTSSLFGGRTIDLAVDPRAFMFVGLLNPGKL